jgi:hypothetical protein
MPARRSVDTTPDLFSISSQAKVAARPAAAKAAAAPERKYLLPKDLALSLSRLDDGEIDALLSAVTVEAERRGRLPKRQPSAADQPLPRRPAVEEIATGLTTGKLNAVRAAFKAGVKPSAIARQFGISQSDVKKALNNEGGDRKAVR